MQGKMLTLQANTYKTLHIFRYRKHNAEQSKQRTEIVVKSYYFKHWERQ